MSNLISKGLIEVEGMKFHDIEGGFEESKKAMLVKDIANIHGRDLKDINRNINNNIKRFKKGIDILDLKVGDLKSLSLSLGYTNQSYANANNIYLLSERGYAKLLKILEDDIAWEQYEKLVDGYFNMRKVIKEQPKESYTIQNPIERAKVWIKEQEEKQKLIEENEKNKPKVLFAEAVESSEDVILVKEMATIITQNGFKIGQNQMFEYLRKYQYLCSKKGGLYNLPTKKHEDLFKVTKRTVQHTQGIEVKNTPKITGKGQLYFIKKFAEYKLQDITIKELLNEN